MKTTLVFDHIEGHTSMTVGNDEDGTIDIPHVFVRVNLVEDEVGEPAFQVSFPGQLIRQTEIRDHFVKILRRLGSDQI